jgi:uncharacterized repeat protein (TIGR01451 family)
MRALAGLFAAVLCLAGGAARADTPVTLFKTISGNVTFAGTQNTRRTTVNGAAAGACADTPISATLAGIPATATILSAQLYWASSGASDTTVNFDGTTLTAPASRQYISNAGAYYYGNAADVTAQVSARRNGSYAFSGLAVANGTKYCGGFALLVVYSDPGEQSRVLNLYEGFQAIQGGGITFTMNNFRLPNPLGVATGRIGHISWEGDPSSGPNGEDLLFNGYPMTDGLNPSQNQFNSASNVNNDGASYGVDFDAYTVDASRFTAGQASIATRFQTGQDLVLLNAEIVAVPHVDTTDLALAMARNSVLTQGALAAYTLSVSNGGPKPETGPVVVTTTLPAGLAFFSAGGTGWSCGAAGQVVTCSNGSTLAAGASLAPITVTVRVDGSGAVTTSATLAGALFDSNGANNAASDTSTIVAPLYAFTDAACVSGKAFGSAQQTCKQLSGKPVLAGEAAAVFVTSLAGGVPTAPSTTADTTVKLIFAISCINPATNAGIQASYAGALLKLCTANGNAPGVTSAEWSSVVSMVFKAGAASAAANAVFTYEDVGRIQLYLRDGLGNVASAVPFVVKPAALAITAVIRNAGAVPNPGATTGAGAGFARVGEPFTVIAVARTTTAKTAPNFGKEGARLVLDSARGGDAAAIAAMADKEPQLGGDFTSVTKGEFTGSAFSVDDAGIVLLTPRLDNNDYLGAGAPPGPNVGTVVGRFYPDHFDTVATRTIDCLPHMNCPAGGGAAYSAQAFGVTVRAMGASGAALSNYRGVLARDVTLDAYTAAGGTAQHPAGYVLSKNSIGAANITGNAMALAPVYTLPQPFSNLAPRARNWTAPATIVVRASAQETVATNTGTAGVTVSSLRAVAADSAEGGITIVSGRLALDNPHGSELMKMPVRAEAQYWTAGGRWETSARDNISVLRTGGIAFSNCRQALGAPCKPVLGVTADAQQTLKSGGTTFWLKAPGAGNHGSADFQMDNPAWLPSTIGRAVFGIYSSPLIYLREVY